MKAPTQPRWLVSDNGSEFVNDVIDGINKIAAIRHTTVSVRNPKANTYVERANRWMKSAIQVLTMGLTPGHWDHKAVRQALVHLGGVMPSRTRKMTPNFLEYGVDSMNGLDLLLSDFAPKPTDKTLADRVAMMQRARAWAAFSQREASESARKLHDGKIAPNLLNVGDAVWVLIPPELKRSKIEPEYMGPYKLVEWVQKERRSAWVQGADGSDEFRVPVDHIIPELAVPENLKLNFVPFGMSLDNGAHLNSISNVVEQELHEMSPDYQGRYDIGPSYDDRKDEPGLPWKDSAAESDVGKLDDMMREEIRREKKELQVAKRKKQLEEAEVEARASETRRTKAAQSLVQAGSEIGRAIVTDRPNQIVAVRESDLEEVNEMLEGDFEIERIIEHHTLDSGDYEYFVKFVDYDESHNEWIHMDELEVFASGMIEEYERKLTSATKRDFAVSRKFRRGDLCAQVPLTKTKEVDRGKNEAEASATTRQTRSMTRGDG